MLPMINDLGSKKFDNHFPVGWTLAMDTLFRWTKQVASHFGGTRNPMIISWPAKITDKGGLRSLPRTIDKVSVDLRQRVHEWLGARASDLGFRPACGAPADTLLNA